VFLYSVLGDIKRLRCLLGGSPCTTRSTTSRSRSLKPYADTRGRASSYLFGSKDVPHFFTVDSGPARLLFVLSPGGLEGLIREMGEPARSLAVPLQPEEPPDEAEMERMATIAARYGAEILGPPPGQ